MSVFVRAVGCLLGWGLIGLTALAQVGLKLLYWLLLVLGFLLLVFLILFMLLGHLSPLSAKLAIIWGVWFQFLMAFFVLLGLDFGLSFIQGVSIACMNYREQ